MSDEQSEKKEAKTEQSQEQKGLRAPVDLQTRPLVPVLAPEEYVGEKL